MLNRRSLVLTWLAAGIALSGCDRSQGGDDEAAPRVESDPRPTVVFETGKGRIVMQLDRDAAPETVKNFLAHVRAGFYDGLVFHRVDRRLGVIQTGSVTTEGRERQSSAFPLVNEADNGLTNLRGTVAMARTMDPHSATSQFFINLENNPELDFTAKTAQGWGYAVFGRVVEGMEVVDAIGALPTRPKGRHRQFPVELVVITEASIVDRDSPAS